MSWDIYLDQDGGTVEVERHEEGGTFALGGTTRAELNITYNYGALIRVAAKAVGYDIITGMAKRDPDEDTENMFSTLILTYEFAEDAFDALAGKSGEDTQAILRAMYKALGEGRYSRHEDYWAATPGNVAHALNILSTWAEQHPNATWSVS